MEQLCVCFSFENEPQCTTTNFHSNYESRATKILIWPRPSDRFCNQTGQARLSVQPCAFSLCENDQQIRNQSEKITSCLWYLLSMCSNFATVAIFVVAQTFLNIDFAECFQLIYPKRFSEVQLRGHLWCPTKMPFLSFQQQTFSR